MPTSRLALRVVRPVVWQPFRQQEVRRQRMEVALAHRDHAFGERRDHGADDFRPRLLIGLVEMAAPDLESRVSSRSMTLKRLSGRSMSYGGSRFQISRMTSISRRTACCGPRRACRALRRRSADAPALMPKMKRPLREMVEHRRVRRDHAPDATATGCSCRCASLMFFVSHDERREEQQAVGDVLGSLGQMLADERVIKAELVGEDDDLAVFLQRLRRAAMQRMHRHREIAQPHCTFSRVAGTAAGPYTNSR